MIRLKISKSEQRKLENALYHVLNMAVENGCGCGDEKDLGETKYFGQHDKGCHVYIERKFLEKVEELRRKIKGDEIQSE